MHRIAAKKLRAEMSDVLNRVAYRHERFLIERHGNGAAAMVPVEDLELIEAIENRIDLEEARRVLADTRQESVPWEKVKKQLGL